MRHTWRLGLVMLVLACLGGCSKYVGAYQYGPRPAMAYVRSTAATQPSPAASTLASLVGVRRADRKLGIPTSVEVRLRIDDMGPEAVSFDPSSLELTDGSLLNFPPPVVRPNQILNFTPPQSAVVSAYFPFPPGRSYKNTNMEILQLRWTLQVAGQRVHLSVPFYRLYPYYYPYYY